MSAVATPPAPVTTPAPPPSVPAVVPPTARPAAGWTRFRWTIPEYRELGKVDLFRGVKTMLIDGEVYTMPMPDPPHDLALGKSDDLLRTVFATGHHIRNRMGFDVGTDNDPGPDLAVIVGSRQDYAGRTPTTAALIVEIADTSLIDDTTTKAEVYATAGVPDYWVVDVDGRRLFVYRKPEPLPEGLGATAYRSREEYGPDAAVAPLAAPDKPVKVADLLP